MGIIQSGLPLALSVPFILAGWRGFVHRRRSVVSRSAAPCRAAEVGFAAQTIDLEASLRAAVEEVGAVARAHWVGLELAMGAPMTVHTDPGTLRTALHEAMITAIAASPGGEVLVTATVLGPQIHIRVTDDGPGIDERVRQASLRAAGALIALQGGSILVETRPGRGTTVTIRLPLSTATDQAHDREATAELADATA